LNNPSRLRAGKQNFVSNSNYKVDNIELVLYHNFFFLLSFISCFDYLIFTIHFNLHLFLKWSVITLLVTCKISLICNWDSSIKDE